MRSPPSVATGLFAGRYAIEREIGQGASAIVYLARDTQAGTAVALKILRPELAESRASDRFLREIKRTSALQHPNILPVLEAGEHEGQLFFALPYMEGGTLRQLLKREKHLELSRVIEISRTIAEALDHAHERGLIHRDVKPENILFTEGRACLSDFGIARAIDVSGTGGTATTSRSMVRGTPAYMSPEQASGSDDLDGRSDVFSLACVIYEMITGMQAYIGPTDEAVIAQRFIHPPRDVRVYRPTSPPQFDTALQKAFAMMPVDRYRSASALVAALTATAESPDGGRHLPPRLRQRSRRLVTLASVLAVASATALIWRSLPQASFGAASGMDTTRILLLPIEGAAQPQSEWRDDDLIYQALVGWKDIQVVDHFQVADALERRGRISSNTDAQRLAIELAAGRYVRATISPRGADRIASASLYDARRAQSLYRAAVIVPGDLKGAAEAFARLIDSLLLRGAPADSLSTRHARPRSLPAVQAYGRAQAALAQWDLEAADSALSDAVTFDSEYARANFWLAQVRAWRHPTRNTWGPFAERAAHGAEQLDERESRLAAALVRLSKGDYASACAMYEVIARRNPSDVVAWFGIGQCNMMNKTVIRSSSSPSGWGFSGSPHRAMQAYARALELLPSMYRRYERGAYEQLQALLLANNRHIVGYGADSSVFYARPGWIGDSLVLVPYPASMQARGVPLPPGFEEAIRRRRSEFRRLALSWSAAFPASAGAKHAVAMALAQLGDAAAIDTMRAARGMSHDPDYARQLAAVEVLLLIRFGFPENARYIGSAVSLADSLLHADSGGGSAASRALLPLAILLGRCAEADSLVRQGGMDSAPRGFSSDLYVESYAFMIRTTLGCPATATSASLADLIRRADDEAGDRPQTRGLVDGFLLLRPALLGLHAESAILQRLVESTRHRLARAALHASRRENAEAGAQLRAAEAEWAKSDPTADFGYATARLWLAIGDSTNAARVADVVLLGRRDEEPIELNEPGRAAGFAAAAVLRAELARAAGETVESRRWIEAARALYSTAHPDLRRRLAGGRISWSPQQ